MKPPTKKEWRDYTYSQTYYTHIEARALSNGTTVTMARLGPAKGPNYIGYAIVETDSNQVSSVENALKALAHAVRLDVSSVVMAADGTWQTNP